MQSYSKLRLLEIEIQLEDTLRKYRLKPRLLRIVPLFPQYLERNVFIWWSSLELYHHIAGVLEWLEVVLRGFLLVKQVGVEDIELVPLHLLWWRLLLGVIALLDDTRLSIACPVMRDPHSVDILRLPVPEPALCLYGQPVVKLLLILLHPPILLKLHNLLGNQIISFCRLGDEVLAQKVVVLG